MRPKQFTDEELLLTAKEIFINHGPSASIQCIADSLGVSQAAIFKRYKTKNELLLAIMKDVHKSSWINDLKKGPTDENLEQQLNGILESIKKFLDENEPIINMIKFSNVKKEELMKIFPEPPPVVAIKELSKWLTKAQKKGLCKFDDAQVVAITILGSIFVPCHLEAMAGVQMFNFKKNDLTSKISQFILKGLTHDL